MDPPGERTAVRWLGLGLAWTALALTVAAPGLAVVIAGLPNDHYHAFADPMVFVLVGLGAGAAASLRAAARPSGSPDLRQVPALVAAGVVVALVGWNVAHLPPAVTPDGGFPAAAAAATRIETAVTGRPVSLRSLPVFKTAEAYRYPLDPRRGGRAATRPSAEALVIVCDSLFETAIGAPCGGPAEDASLAARPFPRRGPPTLADRFEAAPAGRSRSTWRPDAEPVATRRRRLGTRVVGRGRRWRPADRRRSGDEEAAPRARRAAGSSRRAAARTRT